MGERKVLNKYYPPDFDPAKLPRGKRRESNEMKVRMMLPMSVRCKTCGTFMYKGTKFNTRKEDVLGEDYLGIQVFRFYYRCKKCAAEFCMKTDPKNADYVLEQGATRNYEPWRDEEATKAEAVAKREEEEMGNAMKALENRTLDSKREMDIMAALDEMRALNAQHSRALAALKQAAETQALDDDDAADVAAFYQLRAQAEAGAAARRLPSSDEESGSDGEAAAAVAAGRGNGGAGAGPSGSGGAGSSGSGGAALSGRGGGLEGLKGPAAAPGAGAGAAAGAGTGPRALPPGLPKPSVKVVVKPKAVPPPQPAAATAGSAGAGPVVAAAGGKRGAEEEAAADGAKKQKAAEGAAPQGGGLTGLLGVYGSSGSDSDS
ncbi:hypothetical protein GPECTOR_53g118 [Gonium pectorale]|uniref:Splicing factor YJU2 n=1 Tax=Gonium pectorale TaxID=33097 RepID=A0A150G6R1_GONPE|nr:hypothetical protein GPECTOR_53g118 [Gonium pectorale]|eukprot:KXZ45532.1 hypothetical protein GPECTOR_53g118 [Gonium pectorale]